MEGVVTMKARNILICFIYKLLRVFPIKKNKIVISNYAGNGFGDNGKYIALELLKHSENYDIVWLCRNLNERFPKGIRAVSYRSLQSIYEQVTAKVWIDNRRKAEYVCKRNNQYYIMTWHGGIGPKKIEKEVENILGETYVNAAKNDSQMADLFLAESEFTYNRYKSIFWYDGEVLKCGCPREDILFQDTSDLKTKILRQMGIDRTSHIFLYAPTFRDNMTEKDLHIYKRQWHDILETLSKRFGGKWVGFIRLHPNIAKLDKKHRLAEDDVYDVTDYPDMQELLAVSDMVLTDYSSCVYDFGLTRRPGFMLVDDLEAYKKERDFCIDLDIVPFPIASSDEELIRTLKNFDDKGYQQKLHKFYDDFCGLYPGGHASEVVADRIRKVINQKSK